MSACFKRRARTKFLSPGSAKINAYGRADTCWPSGYAKRVVARPRSFLEEDILSAAIARILPRLSAASVAEIDTLVQVALFSGLGLLLSLSILILDQHIPGEWF
jgi:hypothetical protein